MSVVTAQVEETRESILAAAEERFRQYGYGKTTMAEIAKDCGMSAANLYRYFESKLDIAKVMTRRFLAKKEARLRMLASNQELLAGKRLESFVLEMLRHVHQLWSEHPRINELVDSIMTESPEVMQQHNQILLGILADILSQGRASGELTFDDAAQTALIFLTSTKVFAAPFSMAGCIQMESLQEFEVLARQVVQLLLKGLEAH